jgi:hypothetical protein
MAAEAHGAGLPRFVKAAPWLAGDLGALQHLTSLVLPPRQRVQSATTLEVYYGFGDASAMGFILDMEVKSSTARGTGVTQRRKHPPIHENSRIWFTDWRSWFGLEETDKLIAEVIFYLGNSTSRTLFELMLRLWKVEMDGGLKLRLLHVAETCMIEQGIDGGSHGDLTQGRQANSPICLLAFDSFGAEPRLGELG